MESYVIGIDVGGTFTDIVASTGAKFWRAKSPTVPEDFAVGVTNACRRVAQDIGISIEDLIRHTSRFGLGTTAVTNVLVSRTGAKAALLTTAGFEDLMPNAKGRRTSVEGWLEPQWSPIPRDLIAGINERINHSGQVIRPLDEAAVLSMARAFVEDRGVEALAISFLWSFINDQHEARAAQIIRERYPNLPVFVGSEIHPVMREYERTTVVALNAMCSGSVDGIARLEQQLRALGLTAPFLVLQANGGAMTVDQARVEPIKMVDSGPAAGVVAAAAVAASFGLKDAICGDMGGTSYDVAVVSDGMPVRRQRGEVGGVVTARSTIDVESVGSGGGSIAWIDKRQVLRVGPRSARAMPGPACYGRGGIEPTVTDAMLVLGYLDADKFLGGSMQLDTAAARDACERVGSSLALKIEEVAWGIREIALLDMVRATRGRMASAGVDAETAAFITYGGSGSLFACEIARAVGVRKVIAPEMASVLSAFGAASAPLVIEKLQNVNQLFDQLDTDQIAANMERLSNAAERDMDFLGVPSAECAVRFEADVRFVKQLSELTVPIAGSVDDGTTLRNEFVRRYEAKYGRGAIVMGIPIEFVSLRAISSGFVGEAKLPTTRRAESGDPSCGKRAVQIDRTGPRDVAVLTRSKLQTGCRIEGPALVEDVDNTLWIPPEASAEMARSGSILVTL